MVQTCQKHFSRLHFNRLPVIGRSLRMYFVTILLTLPIWGNQVLHLQVIIKQIMSGLKGNRHIYLPERFRIASLLTEAQPRSIGTLGEAILNLKGQIDSLLPEGPVIICFIIPLCYSKKKMIF